MRPLVVTVIGTLTDWVVLATVIAHVPTATGVMVNCGGGAFGCVAAGLTFAMPAHVFTWVNAAEYALCETLKVCAAPAPVAVKTNDAGNATTDTGVGVGDGVTSGSAVGVAVAVGVGDAVATETGVGLGVGLAPAGVAIGDARGAAVVGGGAMNGADPFGEQPAATVTMTVAATARGLSMWGISLSEASSRVARPRSVHVRGSAASRGRSLDAVSAKVQVMEKPQRRPPEESFVVRISAEDPRASPGRWRATVVHVGSGERRYVNSYSELCSFIEARRRSTGGDE
jgi:hypothetical protein